MRTFIILCAALFSTSLYAQTASQIATGRPGQAIGPNVLGTGIIQIQSGVDLQRIEDDNLKNSQRTLNNIVRLGLGESFEISTIVDYRAEEFETTTSKADRDGFSEFQLGFRNNLIAKSDGWIPAIGVQTRFRLKQVGSAYRRQQLAPVFLLATNHQLNPEFSLTMNGGVAYDGVDPAAIYSYVASLTQQLNDRFSTTYEAYGNQVNELRSDYLGVGLAYQLNSNTQYDAYLSSGRNRGVRELYITFGVSWRTWLFNR